MTRSFIVRLGLFDCLSLTENKKGGIIPLEINLTLCIKPMSPKGTSIKPKNKYIIADYLFLVNMAFMAQIYISFDRKR